jgi:hypothetical protein
MAQWLNPRKNYNWLAFPSLLRFMMLLSVMSYALSWVNPTITQMLDFDREKILTGEVWRLITFPFIPERVGGLSVWSIIFLYCMIMTSFLISDSLENCWGILKTSVFVYVTWILLIIGGMLVPGTMWNGLVIASVAFCVFGTYYPRYEFRLFFILPVQVGFLAALTGAYLVYDSVTSLQGLATSGAGVLAYLMFVGPDILRGKVQSIKQIGRRHTFKKRTLRETASFNCCAMCGATELSHPDAEFRIAADGEEYCQEHLPKDG